MSVSSAFAFSVLWCAVLGSLAWALYETPHEQQSSSLWLRLWWYMALSGVSSAVAIVTSVYQACSLDNSLPATQQQEVSLPAVLIGINTVARIAQLAVFFNACWIMFDVFPWRKCGHLTFEPACDWAHFVAILSFSNMALCCLICCCCIPIVIFLASTGRLENVGIVNNAMQYAPMPDAARERLISALPLTRTPSGTDCCVICQEYESESEWRVLPCGHKFHSQCVDAYLAVPNRSCPMCRQDPTQPGVQRFGQQAYGSISETTPQSEESHLLGPDMHGEYV